MTPVRVVYYVVDPFRGTRVVMAALVATDSGVVVVPAPASNVPAPARANVERILLDLMDAPDLEAMPYAAGSHIVGGAVISAPVPPNDAPSWVRQHLLEPAA